MIIAHGSPHRNRKLPVDGHSDRRVQAIARLAQECSPRQISSLIVRATTGDEAVCSALTFDAVTIDDLRELLQGQGGSQVLEQFRWRGHWTGTMPRLFILADSEERGLSFMEREALDPYRCFAYDDAAEVRRDVAINDDAGVATEVVIIGFPA